MDFLKKLNIYNVCILLLFVIIEFVRCTQGLLTLHVYIILRLIFVIFSHCEPFFKGLEHYQCIKIGVYLCVQPLNFYTDFSQFFSMLLSSRKCFYHDLKMYKRSTGICHNFFKKK